jgi:hypothetical protein
VTYPLHLRAEPIAGQDAILLTGYVPNDRLRDKAVALARITVAPFIVVDQLVVQPQMALNFDAPVEPNQAFIVQDTLEKAAPGVGKSLQVAVDGSGFTTISGRVDEFTDRLKIIHALQGIPGCTSVRYDLKVYSAGTTAPAPVVAVAPVVSPAMSIPAPVAKSPKTLVMATDVKPIDTSVAVTSVSSFPKLIGPISTAKQPSPSLADLELKAHDATISAIVQVNHQQVASVPARELGCSLVLAGTVKAANQQAQQTNTKLTYSSLSGLLPPTGRTVEVGIQLGSPMIVRTSFEVENQKSTPVKSSELTQSSMTTPKLVLEPTPESINFMPRLGK